MNESVNGLTFNVVLDSRINKEGLSKILFRLKQGAVKRDISTKIY